MAKLRMDLLEQTASGVTVRVHTPPPQGFTETLDRFVRELDTESLMGLALTRSPGSAAEGLLEVLVELAELWEAE